LSPNAASTLGYIAQLGKTKKLKRKFGLANTLY
jgi:hypothetical protein